MIIYKLKFFSVDGKNHITEYTGTCVKYVNLISNTLFIRFTYKQDYERFCEFCTEHHVYVDSCDDETFNIRVGVPSFSKYITSIGLVIDNQ